MEISESKVGKVTLSQVSETVLDMGTQVSRGHKDNPHQSESSTTL